MKRKVGTNELEQVTQNFLSRSHDLQKLANRKRKEIDDLDKLVENLILWSMSIL